MQGLGYEALAAVLAAVRPSHSVLMQAPAARRNLPPEPFWLPPPPAGALPPPPPVIVQLPAADAPAPDAGMPNNLKPKIQKFNTCAGRTAQPAAGAVLAAAAACRRAAAAAAGRRAAARRGWSGP